MSDTSTAVAETVCIAGMLGIFFSPQIASILPPMNGAGGNGDSTCYATVDHRGHPNHDKLRAYGVDSPKNTFWLMTQSMGELKRSARENQESGRLLESERLWAPAKCHNPQSDSCGKWPRTIYSHIEKNRFPGIKNIQDWERLQGNSNLSITGKPIDCSMSYGDAVKLHNTWG
jgi:hypothetical protein